MHHTLDKSPDAANLSRLQRPRAGGGGAGRAHGQEEDQLFSDAQWPRASSEARHVPMDDRGFAHFTRLIF